MAASVFKLFVMLLLPCPSFTINVTPGCWEDVTEFLSDLNAENPKAYALKMYDSVGKPSSSILSGNVDRLGSYTECVSVKAPSRRFGGQYCKFQVQQDGIDYYIGICVPDSCHEEEVTELAMEDVFKFRTISFLLPIPSPLVLNSTVSFTEVARCSKGLFHIDAFAGICLSLSIFFIILPVVGTIYSASLGRMAKHNELLPDRPTSENYGSTSYIPKKLSTSETERKDSDESLSPLLNMLDKSKLEHWPCSSSSASAAQGDFFTLSNGWAGPVSAGKQASIHPELLAYYYIRGIVWKQNGRQVSVHACLDSSAHGHQLSMPAPSQRYLGQHPEMFFLAKKSPSHLADKTFSRSRQGFKWHQSTESFVDNFWAHQPNDSMAEFRLQPLHMYSVCLLVGLYSVVPWGALWEFSKLEVDNCRQVWWTNLLLINNFVAGSKSCNEWTWYLASDFQFYFTTPLLVFFSSRAKHWLIVLGTSLFLATFTVTALLSSLYKLPVANPHDMRKMSTVMYFAEYYSKPYCRYGPFLIGILLGLFLYHQQTPVLRSKVQASVGWLSAMFSMFMVVTLAYTLEDTSGSYLPAAAIYQALHRTVWAMAVGWIIFACEEGYGGFINEILSWSVWTVVAKISYACYLVHPMLILLYNGLQETFMHYSDINMLYLFLGHCLTTLVVGLALTVMIEMPFQELRRSWAHTRQDVVRL
ncbi:hypothetical protein JRQ81_013192 [Phrynocephalus forsythii]|uniref:Nose resistant-to-fluoxetine protein N-terminal domain-containing protein n=1 Tax=Phrynocephalus forsythii TaxID=171643 RepID=A0A9Q1B4I6_9SAUR|nr:hypothetical protein JRQ81_013192 [Phrynocephalus forsythii]